MVISIKRILLVVALVALSGCGITKMKAVWVDPAYQGKGFQKVLVMGVSENETYLRMFEFSLSRELEKRGVQSKPGYSLFPNKERPAKEAIVRQISEKGFDAIIISKVSGKSRKEVVYPGNYLNDPYFYPPSYDWRWYDYYDRSFNMVHTPYVRTYEIITVQSNLYETASDKLIWSAVSETYLDNNVEDVINSLVETLIKKLKEMRLI